MSHNSYTLPPRASRYMPRQWLDRVREIRHLDHSLKFLLPEPLRDHCWPAGISGRQLTLVTDSSTWATQLRYQQQQILKQINSDLGLKLNKLRVRISTRRIYHKKQWPPRRLSTHNAEMIRAGARSIPDPEVREALLRLANKGDPSK